MPAGAACQAKHDVIHNENLWKCTGDRVKPENQSLSIRSVVRIGGVDK
jgi:hypothetical protein